MRGVDDRYRFPSEVGNATVQTVRDGSGRTYLLVKRSAGEWLVRDPRTGEETYRPAADLEVVDDASILTLAAETVPAAVRTVLTAVRTDRSLGLLVDLDRAGPLAVRTMLERYDYCESDLHGRLAEFQAAGLIEQCRVAGERGYATTDRASEALETVGAEEPP